MSNLSATPQTIAVSAPEAPTAALPEWAPQVGATVHIRANGPRRPAIPYTLESYSIGADGAWIFKAVDFAAWSYIGEVSELEPMFHVKHWHSIA